MRVVTILADIFPCSFDAAAWIGMDEIYPGKLKKCELKGGYFPSN